MGPKLPRPLHRFPVGAALQQFWGGAAAPAPLAALYNGGKELQVGGVHAPRDSDGYYVSPTTGARLLIEPDKVAGDALAAQYVYADAAATILNSPTLVRRAGWGSLSDTAYVTTSPTPGASTVMVLATASAAPASQAVFDSSSTLHRFGISCSGTGTWAALKRSSPAAGVLADSGLAAANQQRVVGATITAGGAMACGVYDPSTGSEQAYATVATTAPTQTTDQRVGRNPNNGYAWSGSVHWYLVWRGVALSQSEMLAVAAGHAAGMTIDELIANFGADSGSDGSTIGAYDDGSPTMPTISGSGASVTVEQPATVQATAARWRQASASAGVYLSAADASLPASGTALVVLDPLAIDAGGATLVSLVGGTASAVLSITPGTPDTLDATVAGVSVSAAYTSDALLYDGSPKLAWVTWTTGGSVTCGWGAVADGLASTPAALGAVSAQAAAASIMRGISGDYQVAVFDRVLTSGERDAYAASLALSGASGDAYLLPLPLALFDGQLVTSAGTQVQDETAHTWALNTTDGTAQIQGAR